MIDMTGYYDYVLGLIPLLFGGVTAVLFFAGFDPSSAVLVAALPAVGLMGHAMFVRGPVAAASRGRLGDGAGPVD